MDCLFCKFVSKEIPVDFIYEDDFIIAIKDINPQAPVHFLVISKAHIESLDKLKGEHDEVITDIFRTIPALTREQGIDNGYRVVNNCGSDGDQTIHHLHFHVLGKRQMLWPPG